MKKVDNLLKSITLDMHPTTINLKFKIIYIIIFFYKVKNPGYKNLTKLNKNHQNIVLNLNKK